MKLRSPALLVYFCASLSQAGEIISNACFNCPELETIADSTNFSDGTYYADALAAVAVPLTAGEIKAAITQAISQNHKNLTYAEVWTALTETDEDPNNSSNVILLYRGNSIAKMSNGSGTQSSNPDNWNREHVWAKSHGFPEQNFEGYTDIHHLRPADISVNSSRGNLDFDNSDAPLSEAPENRVDNDSFEPRDSVKGDVARMIFYMDTRYEGFDTTPDLQVVDRLTSTGEAALGRLCRLLEWNNLDPVDVAEENRNNRIYEFQGNRNPFIDHPEWVELLYSAQTCVGTGDSGGGAGGGDTGGGTGGDTGGGTGGGDTGGTSNNPKIIISGVIDGPLTGGIPKAIELYIANDIADLSVCGIGSANNGGGSDGQEFTFPVVSAAAGTHLYIATEISQFNTFFGFDPDYTSGAANINGDDAIELFCNDEVVDVFGDINVDGSGQPWEYLDGWAYRNIGTGPDGSSFELANWNFSGKNALDNQSSNATASTPFPSKSFTVGNSLVITGIFDGPLSGGTPKAIEIYVASDIADLSTCGIGSANNGGGSDGEEFTFPNDSMSAGSYFYIATESAGFEAFFGFAPTYIHGSAAINGDDAVELFCDNEVVDVFGDINVDGTGQPWEYQDGWAYRIGGTGPDGADFNLTSWFFSGKNKLDGESNNNSATTPFPIASFADSTGDEQPPVSLIGQCTDEATLISAIQGDADISPVVNQNLVIEGVVTGVFPALSGFFIQEEQADQDANAATSEGLFVFNDQNTITPNTGDVARVIGIISERFGKTQLSANENIIICGTNNVIATELTLPLNALENFEALEGMLVNSNSVLTVTDNFELGHFGEVVLSNGRLFNPTNLFAPNSIEATDLANSNALNKITLDDGIGGSNPSEVIYPTGGLSASNTLRTGDLVTALTGIMDFSFSKYRIIPTQEPTFLVNNNRTPAPELLAGNVKIASLNVLNLFNGDGTGSGFPTSRGADSLVEYERQITKTVSALTAINADVVGLMEIENDGVDANSTIVDLVSRLNVQAGENTYAFINTGGAVGTDAIAVALLYKPSVVSPAQAVKINNNAIFNRPPLAQMFSLNANGEQFTVVVNHFKSKGGCSSASGLDKDQSDGQACFNARRVAQSIELINWLNTDADLNNEKDVLVIGDLNAYAKEDPITQFTSNGFTNLINNFVGNQAYSYVFGGELGYLDHALASPSLFAKTLDATEWHINADEPRVLDYNIESKSNQQQSDFYSPDAYRMSDHDPVVISLDMALRGDWDRDDDVDVFDMRALILAIQHNQEINPSFDLNEDNVINMLDVRVLKTLCTRRGCAPK